MLPKRPVYFNYLGNADAVAEADQQVRAILVDRRVPGSELSEVDVVRVEHALARVPRDDLVAFVAVGGDARRRGRGAHHALADAHADLFANGEIGALRLRRKRETSVSWVFHSTHDRYLDYSLPHLPRCASASQQRQIFRFPGGGGREGGHEH